MVFVVLLCLYSVKALLHPNKVFKEWACPQRSNSFSIPFIIILLFAYVIDGQFPHSHKMAHVPEQVTSLPVVLLLLSGLLQSN